MNPGQIRTVIHRLLASGAAALLLAALLVPAAPASAATDEVEFESVKKGRTSLDEGEMAWQASISPTGDGGEDAARFGAGFLYAGDDTIDVLRSGSDRPFTLRKGSALSIVAGSRLAAVSPSGEAIDVIALELLAEDDADDPVGDEVFDVDEGEYELELLRAEFPEVSVGGDGPGEIDLDADDLPALIVVVSGDVEMTAADDDPETLAAGDALTVAGDVTFTQASPDEAIILAVTITSDDETGDGTSQPSSSGTMGAPGGSGAPSGAGAASGGGGTAPTNGGQMASPSPNPSPAPVTDPESDKDGDELTAGREATLGTDPSNRDTDEDGILDGFEVDHQETDPLVPDTDTDGMPDGEEVHDRGTNPTLPDSDFDGIGDRDEVYGTKFNRFTNPNLADTDGDGLDDLQELTVTMTEPTSIDTDYDALYDGDEVTNGTNPLVADDRDGDGLQDGYETPQNYGTNPDDPDSDDDGLTDRQDLDHLTNPLVADTDGDGALDGVETQFGTNPLDPASHP